VVDDVVDSGSTLKIVIEQLQMHNPLTMKTAAIHYKPRSCIVPDFYVHKTTAWVLFSWSMFENISELNKKWEEEGMDQTQILERLKGIGLSPSIVNSFFQKSKLNM
jgi:hypoxanthine phosphoribosyltransferase